MGSCVKILPIQHTVNREFGGCFSLNSTYWLDKSGSSLLGYLPIYLWNCKVKCHVLTHTSLIFVQVVCTFGSMVFVSILLVRGVWSGVTYLRENRYYYINPIDPDDQDKWSRVQPVTWFFFFPCVVLLSPCKMRYNSVGDAGDLCETRCMNKKGRWNLI